MDETSKTYLEKISFIDLWSVLPESSKTDRIKKLIKMKVLVSAVRKLDIFFFKSNDAFS